MSDLFAMLFILLFTSVFVFAFAYVIYSMSYLTDIPTQKLLPKWERYTYYFIALYPVLSLLVLFTLGNIFMKEVEVKTNPQMYRVLIFSLGNVMMGVLSLAVVQYLRRRHKAHNILIVLNTIATSCYAYACLGVFIEGIVT